LTGHVFAFGESRALAIANMVLGLKDIQIRGEVHTNVDYTIDLLNVSFWVMLQHSYIQNWIQIHIATFSGYRI